MFEKFIPLNRKVTVYVPSTVAVDKPVDNSAMVEYITGIFCDSFGGATLENCTGAWKTENGKIVTEKITKIYSYCDTATLEKMEETIIGICEKIKTDMSQEAVSLEVDNKLYFI